MARTSPIDRLPADIKNQLYKELINTNFTDYDHIYSWLIGKGFNISRSSIHRYSVKHKDEIIGLSYEDRIKKANLRLSALNIESQLYSGEAPNAIKDRAELILKWAFIQ